MERGVAIKINEALQKMEQEGIPVKGGHISCYNALSGICYLQDCTIISADEPACRQARDEFWDWLETGQQQMYQDFCSETKKLAHSLECLSQNQIPDHLGSILSKCRSFVESQQVESGKPWRNLQGEIRHWMKSCHVGVVRGCVNRCGSYDNRLNLYAESFFAGGRAFADTCGTQKEILLAGLRLIFDSEDEFQKTYLAAVERDIESKYHDYHAASCECYKSCVSCIRNNPIWHELSGYWGRGTGRYREEIIEGVIGELEKKNIETNLAKKISVKPLWKM